MENKPLKIFLRRKKNECINRIKLISDIILYYISRYKITLENNSSLFLSFCNAKWYVIMFKYKSKKRIKNTVTMNIIIFFSSSFENKKKTIQFVRSRTMMCIKWCEEDYFSFFEHLYAAINNMVWRSIRFTAVYVIVREMFILYETYCTHSTIPPNNYIS